MRRFLVLFLTFLCSSVSPLFAQKVYPITTDVPVVKSSNTIADSLGTVVYCDIWQSTFKSLVDHASNGTIQPYDIGDRPIDLDTVIAKFQKIDTVYSIDPTTLYQEQKIVRSDYTLSDFVYMVSALRIRQRWSITDSGVFKKEVSSYAPFCIFGRTAGKPIFWCHPEAQTGVKRSLVVAYSVDLKKLGDSIVQAGFLNEVKDVLRSGRAEVHNFEGSMRLNKSEISQRLSKRMAQDTVSIIDPIDLTETTIICSSSEPVLISRILFTEQWTLDDRGNFTIKVLKYAPETAIHCPPYYSGSWVPLFDVLSERE